MTETAIVDADVKRLVLARLQVLPANIGIAVGSSGNFSKSELLQHIEDEDEIGKNFIELEMDFLRNLQEGFLFEE